MKCFNLSVKRLIFVVFLCLFCSINRTSAIDISGTIDQDSTLTLAQSPYNIVGNLTINKGAVLTIEDGVVINFPSRSYHIYIGSYATSLGTINANAVSFNGLLGDNYRNYIYFRYGSAGSLTNCTFDNVELSLSSSSPTVQNATFKNCTYLMEFVDECSPTLSGISAIDCENPGIAFKGTINSDHTYQNYNLPYYLTSTVSVRDGATLTFANGDTVYYNSTSDISIGYNASITGTLLANNVHFKGSPTNSTSDQIYFNSGSGGTLINCTFYKLDIFVSAGSAPEISNSVFDVSPITVGGTPTLNDLSIKNSDYLLVFKDTANPVINNLTADNVVNNGIAISGTIKTDYTLPNYQLPYFLTTTLNVRDGATLTIASGDTIYYNTTNDITLGYSNTIGNIVANNVHFKGYYNSSTYDQLYFYSGSGGTISNCTFEKVDVYIKDGAKPHISNSTFDVSPITVLGSPSLQDLTIKNSDYLLVFVDTASPVIGNLVGENVSNMGIALSGTVKTDYTLKNYNLPYYISSTYYIRDGGTLNVESGDTIHFDANRDIYVGYGNNGGSIIASNVHFYGAETPTATGDQLYFYPGAGGTISNCKFLNLDVYIATASPVLQNSSFDNSPITVLGSPTLQDLSIENTNYLVVFKDSANPIISGLSGVNVEYPGISFSGTVKQDYTLKNYNLPYYLVSTFYVRDGATFTIESGDTIYYNTTSDINIGYNATSTGTIMANNVHFKGNSNLSYNSDQLYFNTGSGGTISNSSFTNLDLYINDASPLVQSSVFDNSPITVLGSPTLQDLSIKNTKYSFVFKDEASPVISNIDTANVEFHGIAFSGTINSDLTLKNFDMPYFLTSTLYVRDGATLTLASGDTIRYHTTADIQMGYGTEFGNLVADNVHFYGHDVTNYTSDELRFLTGSGGSLTNCKFLNLNVLSEKASPSISLSEFDNSPIVVSGSPIISNILVKNSDYILEFKENANPTFSNIDTLNIKYPGIALSGNVNEDFTLKNFGFPYYLVSTLTVRDGATLTLAKGNVLNHITSYGIRVGYSANSIGLLNADSVTFYSDYYYGSQMDFRYTSQGTLSNCKFDRVKLVVDGASPSITNAVFRRNPLAVHVKNGAKPKINNSDFFINEIALKNESEHKIDAKNNFWGHYSGPMHADNPTGIGEKIVGDVEFVPFATYPNSSTFNTELINNVAGFDSLVIGETASQFVKVVNKGTADLMIPKSSCPERSFFVKADFPIWVEPNDTAELEVVFAPSTGGKFNSTLHIHTGNYSQKTLDVPVSGFGNAIIQLSDSSLIFEETYLKKSNFKQVYLKNNYQHTVRIDSIITSGTIFRVNVASAQRKSARMFNELAGEGEMLLKSTDFVPSTSVYAFDSVWFDVIFKPRQRLVYNDTIKFYYNEYGMETLIVQGTGRADSLNISIQSIDYKKFPFIYMNVKVDTLGTGIESLTTKDFACEENGVPQTTNFTVIPPGQSGGTRLADIVFIMDNSGSMSDEQSAVRANVNSFVNALSQSGIDYGLGLCRYGAGQNSGKPIFEDAGSVTSDPEYFKNNVWVRNTIDGGHEPGYQGIKEAVNNFSFRPGAQKIIIIITDETPQQGDIILEEAMDACEENSATLFALTLDEMFDLFLPITDATNGEVYDIRSPFNEILDYISTAVSSTYIVQYESNIETWGDDGILAEVFVNYDKKQDSDTIRYYPGGAPFVIPTQDLFDLQIKAWQVGTSFNIKARIIDNFEPFIRSVKLFYRTVGSETYEVLFMTNSSGEFYMGTIPGSFSVAPGVEFYFQVTDGNSTVTSPSVDPLINPYQIAILPNEMPVLTYQAPDFYVEGDSIELTATIEDNTNALDTVILYYRRVGQLIYKSVAMIKGDGNVFVGVVPSDFTQSSSIEYYIKATDDFNVSRYNGLPDFPNVIKEFSQVSINDVNTSERMFNVFPNPLVSGASLSLEFSQALGSNRVEVGLYSIGGQKISTLFAGDADGTIHCKMPKGLQAGIYLLKLKDKVSGRSSVQKVVVIE